MQEMRRSVQDQAAESKVLQEMQQEEQVGMVIFTTKITRAGGYNVIYIPKEFWQGPNPRLCFGDVVEVMVVKTRKGF